MWEFIHKVLLLFIERKDKFKHAEEKLQRRMEYFKEIKAIEGANLDEDEKRARRNALAQRLVGSQLVSFELVDYLIKNKNINNFEIVSKTLALWDTSLKIDRNDDKKIIEITLKKWVFFKEKIMLTFTLCFGIFIFILSMYSFKSSTLWIKNAFLIPEYIAVIFMLCIVFGLLIVSVFLFITSVVLFDLKRIVDLLNK